MCPNLTSGFIFLVCTPIGQDVNYTESLLLMLVLVNTWILIMACVVCFIHSTQVPETGAIRGSVVSALKLLVSPGEQINKLMVEGDSPAWEHPW